MIHVLFCSSAAGTLRHALRSVKRREQVVDLTDDLSWGLIRPVSNRQRADWFNRNVPGVSSDEWEWLVEDVDTFAHHVEGDRERTIWINPHSAQELSGLHWYLDRFGGADIRMLTASPLEPSLDLGENKVESMTNLLENHPRVSWDQTRFPADLWSSLIADNSLLRVVEGDTLQSAPSDFFDHYLLKNCSTAWGEWLRVIGNAMIDIIDAGHRVDHAFLAWRLGELIQAGAISTNGSVPRFGQISRALVKLAR